MNRRERRAALTRARTAYRLQLATGLGGLGQGSLTPLDRVQPPTIPTRPRPRRRPPVPPVLPRRPPDAARPPLGQGRFTAPEIRARLALIDLELRRGPQGDDDADQAALAWLAGATADALLVAWRPDPIHPARPSQPLNRGEAEAVVAEAARADRLVRLAELRSVSSSQLDALRFTGAVFGPTLDLDQVGTTAEVDRLVDIAWWLRPTLRAAGPTLPVLLPVRLETRFFDEGGSWTVKLLVVPDEPWFDSHDPRPTELEVEALHRWWADTAPGSTVDRSAAERALAGAAGGPRAAWLARTFTEPTDLDGIEIVPSDQLHPTNHIVGFPPALALHVIRDGQAPALVAQWAVDVDKLVVDLTHHPDTEPQWWNNFDLAKLVGLGAEVDLGPTVDDIDALVVTGVGDDDPAELFDRHRATGRVGMVPLGTATNTLHGDPGGGEELTAEQWFDLNDLAPSAAEMDVAAVLCGQPTALGALPGGHALAGTVGASLPATAGALAAIVGPALWGHAMADLWDGPDRMAHEVAALARAALRPEGIAHPIRIGDQPYGVVVAADTDHWQADAGDPSLLAPLADTVGRQLDAVADAGERAGTAMGATTEQLLDVIGRTPISGELRTRRLLPSGIAAWFARWFGLDVGLSVQEINDRIEKVRQGLEAIFTAPVGPFGRAQLTYGETRILDLPVVEAGDVEVAVALAGLIESIEGRQFLAFADLSRVLPLSPEPSLLVRLMIRSARVALAAVGRTLTEQDNGITDPEPHRPVLEDYFVFDDPQAGSTGPTDPRLTRMQRWILRSAGGDDSHRPGEAEQLDELTAGLRSLPGMPLDDLERVVRGLFDTASHRLDPWATIPAHWRLDRLTTQAVEPRRRLGAYGWVDRPRPRPPSTDPAAGGLLLAPSEAHALTAAVLRDRAVADPARYDMALTSTSIGRARRLASAVRAGAHPAEHLGAEVERLVADPALIEQLRTGFPLRTVDGARRVCDGVKVLGAATTDPASLGLPTAVVAALAELATTADGYADLLLAEAAFRVVTGRGDRAGAALDAAAGLAPPPELDILRNDRSGHTTTTVVATAVAAGTAVALPADDTGRAAVPPLALVEPALEPLLANTVAALGPWQWTVTDDAGVDTTVTVADLGLTPIETLAYSTAELEGAVLRRVVGDDGATTPPGVSLTSRAGSRHRDAIGRLVRLVADGPAPTLDPDQDPAAEAERRLATVVAARLGDLATALGALTATLAAASDDAAAIASLALAARWGLPGALSDPADPVAAATAAATELAARLSAAGPTLAAASPGLADAMAAVHLVGPHAEVACFAPVTVADLGPSAPVADEARFDVDWLAPVAAVRTPIGGLEAARLEGIGPASVRLRDPAVLWPVDGNGPAHVVWWTSLDLDTATPTDPVAVAVIDRFTETIPEPEVTPAAAVGFDAPRARAPQAVIVAVPHDMADADGDDVVGVVAEVRRLTRVRAAVPETLDHLAGPVPLTAMPMYGPTGVTLHEEDNEA